MLSEVLSCCPKFCEVLLGSLSFFGFSMARKVLSGSPMFCLARRSLLRFAEIPYVSLISLRFAKIWPDSPRFAEVLWEPLCFSEGLQGSVRLYKVLRRNSKARTCSTRFYRLLEASIGFHWVLLGSMRCHKAPKGAIGIPLGFNKVPQLGSMRFHWFPQGSTGFHKAP